MAENKKFWEEIYSTLAPKMLGVCRRYVKNLALAEDLMHDSFVKAMEKKDSFTGKGSFAGWLHRVTVNTVLMHLRESKKYLEAFSIEEPDNASEQKNSDYSHENDREIIEQADFTHSELLEMLDKLADHHRTVFNLYVIDGYTHRQIAQLLGISENTSKSHLARARKKLQAMLLNRAQEMEERRKKRRKRAVLHIPIFGGAKNYVDKIFADGFSDFSIFPSSTFSALSGTNHLTTFPKWGMLFSAKSIAVAATIVVTVTISVILYSKTENAESEAANPPTSRVNYIENEEKLDVKPILNNLPDSSQTVSSPSSEPEKKVILKKEPVIVKKQIVVKDTVYLYVDEDNQ
ncbi:MAG TPA: RNA polymerase sigma factor [Tenuifilaceae bacterium]|nr:RNA polymerase sigma factor [Tenuifilaceae bacterium]HPE18649.1 RNA polymerase sigma factor [Tenuifilaceae bacterium]HPJ45558.1 RNA polymerase sigma factor [Tenuifilaceae bacterium]HPQ33664.1 RNA polymerase sigma factor [Tenuifilaceae bacterium]